MKTFQLSFKRLLQFYLTGKELRAHTECKSPQLPSSYLELQKNWNWKTSAAYDTALWITLTESLHPYAERNEHKSKTSKTWSCSSTTRCNPPFFVLYYFSASVSQAHLIVLNYTDHVAWNALIALFTPISCHPCLFVLEANFFYITAISKEPFKEHIESLTCALCFSLSEFKIIIMQVGQDWLICSRKPN